MEAIRCSSTFFLLSSFFNSHPTLPRGKLPSLTRQWQPIISRPSLRAQALDDAITTTVDSDVHGGNISVFIPLSAALLFMYWVANFFVPNMIMKDLMKDSQPEAWNEEETSEMKEEPPENQDANMPSKLQQKAKKTTLQ